MKIKFNDEKRYVLKDLKKMKTKKEFIQLLSLYLRAKGYIVIKVVEKKESKGEIASIIGKIV